MAIELKGEVGRTARPEDVAIVQTLLANIKGPDGKPFWDRRVDGRAGVELAAAIERFQKAYEVAAYQRRRDEGVVRPGLVTWHTLMSVFPKRLGDLRPMPGSLLALYATKNQTSVAGETAARLRNGTTARERTIARNLRPELAQAVEKVAAETGVGLILGETKLVEDRVAMSFRPVGLSVLDDYGRPLSADARPGDVPAALWREVDRVTTARAPVDAIGQGGYRPRNGLPSLREPNVDIALVTRFGMDASTIRGDKRPVLAALTLIARAHQPAPVNLDELTHLIDIVAADDPETARSLIYHQRRHVLAGQPVHGTGPTPFEQAVDQLLQTIRRNYQSPQFTELKSLTVKLSDHVVALNALRAVAGNRKPWDIKREFPLWATDPVESFEYGRDIWGNVHFGYLTAAAGFWGREMLHLAGVYQYLTHVDSDPGWWKLAAVFLREFYDTWDDPKDQAAIRLGIALWDRHRFPIPHTDLVKALRQHKAELNTR